MGLQLLRFGRHLVVLLVASCTALPAPAADVPRAAQQYRSELVRNARVVWGMDAPVSTFAAQIHQESAWRPGAVSAVGAQGMAQFMPTTSSWIAGLYPTLAQNAPFNPSWALRALVTYDRYLYDRIRARDDCERMAMTLSAYNGGLGWISRDQKRASGSGLDPLIWWGSVETVNAGRSAANWRENRAYPDRIIHHHQPTYVAASWGPGVCP
ncbi:membrane-bound lytic transglycosylase F [Achromobacter xylosoxidans]|uniref:transglycosylase SLT domain-containing protein n=1 Tax=Alcaligenes xylosoxydans xylosoxydans TaxID=85698 RepID=UPI0006BF5D68|nr:transglycosylase SLT domain-containing protein [Achromobacter xylosoxidans]MCH4591374.1 transglycosylase SLT domain-containing protein [Achromobacter xylosoxidans]WOB70862.1 transglycosylase SLT domain-containing protein [Achromobacter xylosoxidans]CUI61340.1 membrane-bound lytic transglycosylase F [Achromobacter xylosoxidans]